ncbi:hypothetical protein GGI12_004458, partial [Dipsacomyces acuminosporus]
MRSGFERAGLHRRTLSWVSSAVSSVAGPNDIDERPREMQQEYAYPEDAIAMDGMVDGRGQIADSASRRQHVRLTTIDPVTDNIVEAYRSSNSSGKHEEPTLAVELGDPAIVQKVFIAPDILRVTVPQDKQL